MNLATPNITNFASKLLSVHNQGRGRNEKLMVVLVMLAGLRQAGYEGHGGAAVGAGATGAGYEYNAYRQI